MDCSVLFIGVRYPTTKYQPQSNSKQTIPLNPGCTEYTDKAVSAETLDTSSDSLPLSKSSNNTILASLFNQGMLAEFFDLNIVAASCVDVWCVKGGVHEFECSKNDNPTVSSTNTIAKDIHQNLMNNC